MDSTPMPKGTIHLLIMRALAVRPTHAYGVSRWMEETTLSSLHVCDRSFPLRWADET